MEMVPLVPAVLRDDGAFTGRMGFSGFLPSVSGTEELMPRIAELAAASERGSDMVIVDVCGISSAETDPVALGRVRSRRMGIWTMSHIGGLDDVFDLFYVGSKGILVPYHLVRPDVLEEMLDVSENIIPAVFTDGRRAALPEGDGDPAEAVRGLSSMGFQRIAVLDVSGRFDAAMWRDIASVPVSVVPYVHGHDQGVLEALDAMGFGRCLILV